MTGPALPAPSARGITLVAIYAAINLPFVYKYAARAGIPGGAASAAYVAAVAVVALCGLWLARAAPARRIGARAYWIGLVLAAAVLAAGMTRFDPDAIRVTRYAALHEAITRLLHGQFPYATAVRTSAFPFLFVCALPFRLLGDLGLFQIAALLVFGGLCAHASRGSLARAGGAMILLVGSPIFLYEVVTRSELFSNMTLVLLLLVLIEGRERPAETPWAGLAAGLLLSTRGIVALVYAVCLTARFRRDPHAGLAFAAWAVVAFVATLVPFALWNPGLFVRDGPFAIQMSYAPGPILALAFAVAVVLGWRARSAADTYFAVTLVLFAVVGGLFAWSAATEGWNAVLLRDDFDISYFAFAHTFLIYGLARGTA